MADEKILEHCIEHSRIRLELSPGNSRITLALTLEHAWNSFPPPPELSGTLSDHSRTRLELSRIPQELTLEPAWNSLPRTLVNTLEQYNSAVHTTIRSYVTQLRSPFDREEKKFFVVSPKVCWCGALAVPCDWSPLLSSLLLSVLLSRSSGARVLCGAAVL